MERDTSCAAPLQHVRAELQHSCTTTYASCYSRTIDHTTHHVTIPLNTLQQSGTYTILALRNTLPSLYTSYRYSQLFEYLGGAFLEDTILSLSWSTTNTCGFVIHNLLAICDPHNRALLPDTIYGTANSILITTLHIITTLLGRYVVDSDSGFTRYQHIAVHLCLVFYVITEFEFYRVYIQFENLDTYTEYLKHLSLANVNPSSPYRRDPFYYMVDLPDSWRRYLDGGNDPRTVWAIVFSKSHNVLHTSYLLFHVV